MKLSSNITGVLTKRRGVDTDMHTETKVEMGTMLLQGKEHQGLPENRPPSAEAWGPVFVTTALRRNQSCQHLDLRFLVFRTVRQQMSAAQATLFIVLCYSSPSKLIHLDSHASVGWKRTHGEGRMIWPFLLALRPLWVSQFQSSDRGSEVSRNPGVHCRLTSWWAQATRS